jgi:hypothetical protein
LNALLHLLLRFALADTTGDRRAFGDEHSVFVLVNCD